jgi:hypothetical protein
MSWTHPKLSANEKTSFSLFFQSSLWLTRATEPAHVVHRNHWRCRFGRFQYPHHIDRLPEATERDRHPEWHSGGTNPKHAWQFREMPTGFGRDSVEAVL